MNALQALEFGRIRADVARYCATEEGRALIEVIEPLTDAALVSTTGREVTEILRALQGDIPAPGGSVPLLDQVFAALRHRGETLDLEGLSAVRSMLETAGEFHRFFHTGEEDGFILSRRSETLRPPREILQSFRRILTGEGRLNEDAIPQIASLRRQITDLHQDLQHSSETIIRASREIYREDRATVRDGRTVLPLVADFKGRLDGIVHESSGSGETLFVEPRELVELNNRLAQTKNEILREIRRVLRELTDSVRAILPELAQLRKELTIGDCLLARGRYGWEKDGRIVPSGDSIDLRQARHPLLGSSCVPLDIRFERGTHLIVLSGPNTGGKTVLLKTLGVLTVMNQCGIPIPAAEGSSLPFYRWIGVDIGDEQSIDEALSTFSAHLRTLGEITRRADVESLVLLDELGTGTDPEEGAALSLAIIDHLMERGCTVLVTTHQTVLKHYGYTREGASNAAMAFDEEEHRPTYRVIPGKPGVSHAIETALEQGLAPAIVDRARQYHQDHHSSVAGIIARLLEEEEQLQARGAALQRQEDAFRSEEEHLRAVRQRLEEREMELKQAGLQELNRVLRDARSQLEQEIRALRERGVQLEREEIQSARRPLQELEQLREQTDEEIQRRARAGRAGRADRVTPDTLNPGVEVRHRVTGRTGTVRSVRRERVEVQFGAVRMTVSAADLLAVENSGESPRSSRSGRVSFSTAFESGLTPGAPPALELDLRGYRLEHALEELERQVDAAILHNLSSFSVIHGMGTGVLQKGVQEYLRTRGEVAQVHFARPEEGGYGKTVVEFT